MKIKSAKIPDVQLNSPELMSDTLSLQTNDQKPRLALTPNLYGVSPLLYALRIGNKVIATILFEKTSNL